MKKLDTHVHTSEVSHCGKVKAARMAELYIAAGYGAITICDHLTLRQMTEDGCRTPQERLDYQLRGYRAAKEAAGDKLDVLLGAEIRFHVTPDDVNDYLIFGLDEDKYLALVTDRPRDPAECHRFVNARNCLFYQAHPFRDGIYRAEAEELDGIEVYNGHPNHNSRNNLALALAEERGCAYTSGSDAHQEIQTARGGIWVPEDVHTAPQLADFLRRNPRPELIRTIDEKTPY